MIRRRELTADEAYARLADRCAMAEVCTYEALEKLRAYGLDAGQAERVVERLVDERFIDDERYARAYVRDRVTNARWGLIKIRQAMRLKRLGSQLIETAIAEELDEERYFSNLAAALRSKARNMPGPLGNDDRLKLMRFAASRGYEPSLITDMVADEEYWRGEE